LFSPEVLYSKQINDYFHLSAAVQAKRPSNKEQQNVSLKDHPCTGKRETDGDRQGDTERERERKREREIINAKET